MHLIFLFVISLIRNFAEMSFFSLFCKICVAYYSIYYYCDHLELVYEVNNSFTRKRFIIEQLFSHSIGI